ncbi:hypothetical protein D3C80_1895950 [compost metagenome]
MLGIVTFQKGRAVDYYAYRKYPALHGFAGQPADPFYRTEIEQHHLDEQPDEQLDGDQNIKPFDKLQIR